ncbi:hypothetical protein MycrhDRAFT_5282 [Mycolicibacterium rhodesiae JS60]|nr:hypothetical protein MycrhDRAFT_5282 [Mycolicibacterium rhodesiae JS60]
MALQKPKQLNSRFVLVASRFLSRAHTLTYRISRGRLGANLRVGAGFRKPAPTLLLDHVGRKSGRRFTTPLVYMRDGADIVVVASAAGRDKNPQWYYNLLAHPATQITIGADRHSVTAHQADADERSRLWPHLVDTYTDFDSYQSWTDRKIPVIVLEPRSSA